MADVSVLILYNDKGEIYLQHRTAYKARWANYWGTFGGGIDEGESVAEALRREIYEEMQYRVIEPTLLYVQQIGESKKYLHVEQYDISQTIIPSPEECQDARWFTIDDALQLENIIPHDHELLGRVREHLEQESR